MFLKSIQTHAMFFQLNKKPIKTLTYKRCIYILRFNSMYMSLLINVPLNVIEKYLTVGLQIN